MMIINGLPAEAQITAADLKSAVYAVTHAVLAGAVLIAAIFTGRSLLLIPFALWALFVAFNTSDIGRRDGNKQEKVPPRVVIRERQP